MYNDDYVGFDSIEFSSAELFVLYKLVKAQQANIAVDSKLLFSSGMTYVLYTISIQNTTNTQYWSGHNWL